VGTAASYGVDAHEAHSTDEVIKLVESGIADRERPTLINVRTTPSTHKSSEADGSGPT
jgi:benzoylformate decarboxylase